MNESIDHKDITARLKFIGRLAKGDKINTKNLFVQQNNWFDKLSRSIYYIDDRGNTLVFLTDTLSKAFDLFQFYHVSAEPFCQIQARNIINDMRATKKGMMNLKDTYADDMMFMCKIDALIEETEAKLDEIREKYYSDPK